MERHLAGVLARTVREADALCRCEDGKFALALRATDAGRAMQAARRIQSAVAREAFIVNGDRLLIELAIGLASASDACAAPPALMTAAEDALQRAMGAGEPGIVSGT